MKMPEHYRVISAEFLGKHVVLHMEDKPKWAEEEIDCVLMPKKNWEKFKNEYVVSLLFNVFWLCNWLLPHLANLVRRHHW